MSYFKSLKLQLGLSILINLALGLMFLIIPEKSGAVICAAVSIIAIVAGIAAIIGFLNGLRGGITNGAGLALGAVLVASGIFFICNRDLLQNLIGTVIGLSILFSGAVKLQQGFNLKKLGVDTWKASMLLSAVGIVLGIVILAFFANKTLGMMIGISLIICASMDLVLFIQAISVSKNANGTTVEVSQTQQDEKGTEE